jgi:hypothetical protein
VETEVLAVVKSKENVDVLVQWLGGGLDSKAAAHLEMDEQIPLIKLYDDVLAPAAQGGDAPARYEPDKLIRGWATDGPWPANLNSSDGPATKCPAQTLNYGFDLWKLWQRSFSLDGGGPGLAHRRVG